MTKKKQVQQILGSNNQLKLYGYEEYFKKFVELYIKKSLPNVILLNGPKGLGKSTFIYHLVNYILSLKEEDAYNKTDLIINSSNKSYNLIDNSIHPNFFLLDNDLKNSEIKIEKVRNLIKFHSKSTYLDSTKIILIDNAENLNINSSNALLKILEESGDNTFFFIIENSSSKVLDTIRSRSIEFKIFFTLKSKKQILKKLLNQYDLNIDISNIDEILRFETPGNLIKYFKIFGSTDFSIFNDNLSCIFNLLDKYKNYKDINYLTYASFFIENYYRNLYKKNINNINVYFSNKNKILNYIHNMKKYNLDNKNLLFLINDILENEK